MKPKKRKTLNQPKRVEVAESEQESLIVCVTCEKVTSPSNAKLRTIITPDGPASVWVCRTCERLGRGEQVRKYVMKELKKAGR